MSNKLYFFNFYTKTCSISKNIMFFFIFFFCFLVQKDQESFCDIPRNGQISFQDPATSAMTGIIDLHHEITFWLAYVLFFVFQMLIFEIYYFSIAIEKNLSIRFLSDRFYFASCSLLEWIWTVIPILVLWAIASPSISLLYSMEEEKQPQFTAKIIGHQWYWTYETSDFISYESKNIFSSKTNNIFFDSSMQSKNEVNYGKLRLLDVDNSLYLPTHIDIRFIITSEDVIHSWTVPSLGVKLDAVPGRLNSSIVYINRPGIFYGQCSELCGVGHGFMPICIHSTSKITFIEWIVSKLNLNKFNLIKKFIIESAEAKMKPIKPKADATVTPASKPIVTDEDITDEITRRRLERRQMRRAVRRWKKRRPLKRCKYRRRKFLSKYIVRRPSNTGFNPFRKNILYWNFRRNHTGDFIRRVHKRRHRNRTKIKGFKRVPQWIEFYLFERILEDHKLVLKVMLKEPFFRKLWRYKHDNSYVFKTPENETLVNKKLKWSPWTWNIFHWDIFNSWIFSWWKKGREAFLETISGVRWVRRAKAIRTKILLHSHTRTKIRMLFSGDWITQKDTAKDIIPSMNNVIPPTVSNAEIVIKKGPNPLYIRMMAVRTQIKMTRYLICQLERTRAFRKALAQKDENKMIDIIDKAFEDAHKGKDFFWFKKKKP